MVSMRDRLDQDRRRAVLMLLAGAESYALNEDILVRELSRVRLGVVTRDDMRAILAWLERASLVSIERLSGGMLDGDDLWAATATRAGRDVARGAAHHGISRQL